MSPSHPTILAVGAEDEFALARVRHCFRSYADEFAETIAESLRHQGFESELAGLPGEFAPPSGCLLLALVSGQPAGCVALRDLGGGTCEMKRLYVAPTGRGRGLGRLLVSEILRRAADAGYRRMVLDTLPEMAGALALYRSFGFEETAPYGDSPVGRTLYLEKALPR